MYSICFVYSMYMAQSIRLYLYTIYMHCTFNSYRPYPWTHTFEPISLSLDRSLCLSVCVRACVVAVREYAMCVSTFHLSPSFPSLPLLPRLPLARARACSPIPPLSLRLSFRPGAPAAFGLKSTAHSWCKLSVCVCVCVCVCVSVSAVVNSGPFFKKKSHVKRSKKLKKTKNNFPAIFNPHLIILLCYHTNNIKIYLVTIPVSTSTTNSSE